MFRAALFFFMVLTIGVCRQVQAAPEATHSAECASCHSAQHSDWLLSHHQQAMATPTRQTVLAPFEGESFSHLGNTTRFHRTNDQFMITTTDTDSGERTFPVSYVFGVYPLQQYLIPLSGGRLQAFTIAWDARPAAEQGQRWYHLSPDEAIAPDDPLHWTGLYQNWNNSCAECHSTNVEKNYQLLSDSYDTSFSEVSVGCEGCHGPAREHLLWAQGDQSSPPPAWPTDLNQRAAWQFTDGPIAQRASSNDNDQQIMVCARCHSRRSHLGDYEAGQALSQTHRLALIEAPLYYPDGQIRDEVFVHGSFIQSKMYQAGVTCTDCHNPNTGRTYASDNGLCASCHLSQEFDTPAHHRHPQNSEGAQCVNCHMPATVYMGVDARRDHSMQIPRPDLSINTGSHNACTQCHQEMSNNQALEHLIEWDQLRRDDQTMRTLTMAKAWSGDLSAQPDLQQIITNAKQPDLWRASALSHLVLNSNQALDTMRYALADTDGLVRSTAVRTAADLPEGLRRQLLLELLGDSDLSVRLALAYSLADISLSALNTTQRAQLEGLFQEYRKISMRHADQPEQLVSLADFERRMGNRDEARIHYQKAISKNKQLLAAYINLADLDHAMGANQQAIKVLKEGLNAIPNQVDLAHALGLALIRDQRPAEALPWLKRAAEASNPLYQYVYAIALHDQQKSLQAIAVLQDLVSQWPNEEDALMALTHYLASLNRFAEAATWATKLTEIAPSNRQYARWQQQLSARARALQ